MTITDFLLARIAEDEAVARDCAASVGEHARLEWIIYEKREIDGEVVEVRRTLTPYDPARVLAECEAKRRIVDEYVARDEDVDLMLGPNVLRQREWSGLRLAVRVLAAVYADHPDYQQEWALS